MPRRPSDDETAPHSFGQEFSSVPSGRSLTNPFAQVTDQRWAPEPLQAGQDPTHARPSPEAPAYPIPPDQHAHFWSSADPVNGIHDHRPSGPQRSAGYPAADQASVPAAPTPPWAGPAPAPAAGKPIPNSVTRASAPSSLPVKIIAGIVIAVVALAGVLLMAVGQLTANEEAAPVGPQHLSRPAPPGWQTTFTWSTDIPAVTGTIAVGQNRVAFLDTRGTLHVLDADSGSSVFSTAANPVTTNAKPFIALAQDTPVAGVVDGPTLLMWPLDGASGAEARQISLALNARVYQHGGGLMVSTGKEHWVVTSAFTLAPVIIPADHVALGVTPDGLLLSAPPRGGWTVWSPNPSTAPKVIHPEANPPGTVGEVQVAWSSRGILVAWGNTSDPESRTVGLYEVASGRLLASETLPTATVQNGLPLTVSPGATYASAGPLLARLSDGDVRIVERWSTIMSDSKNLYGTRDGVKMVWSGGEAAEMDPKAVVPWGVSERGYAIVLDPLQGNLVRLGALRATD